MNLIFFSFSLIAFLTAAWHQFYQLAQPGVPSPMERLSKAMVDSAASSVELALSLIGVMTLFLGLMKVAEAGGLLKIISRLIRPLMVRLFPEVPAEHPAMGAMILNISANVLGLGNAATPFGIRAMQELNSLNPRRGVATNPMVLFLAINTSSVTLLPTGVIALRAAAGSANPAGIMATTLFATMCSTVVAVFTAKLLQRFFSEAGGQDGDEFAQTGEGDRSEGGAKDDLGPKIAAEAPYPSWVSGLALLGVVSLVPLTLFYGKELSPWVMPVIMIGFLAFGAARRVRVYEAFVEGARDGFQVAVKIIPYLVAILVTVGMLRASGAMEAFVSVVGAATSRFGLPPEGLLMGILRPLSGSGAFAVLASIIRDPAIGPDSYTGYLVSTIQGCTETTFYVLAVYFGAVQVRRTRHAVATGLVADLAGVAGAVVICSLLYR